MQRFRFEVEIEIPGGGEGLNRKKARDGAGEEIGGREAVRATVLG